MRAITEAVAALAEIREKKYQPIPKHWFSLDQYMEHEGCGHTRARKDMNELRKAGKLETQSWPVLGPDNRTRHKTIYKKK